MGEAKTKPKGEVLKSIPVTNGARIVALEVLRQLAKAGAGRDSQRGLARVIRALDWSPDEEATREALVDDVDQINVTAQDTGLTSELIERRAAVRRRDRAWTVAATTIELSVDTIRSLYEKLTAVEGMTGRQVELLEPLMDVLSTAKDNTDAYAKTGETDAGA